MQWLSDRSEPREQTEPSGALAGVGLGWRPEIAGYVADLHRPGFVEVVGETIGATLPEPLKELTERGVPVIVHGTRLSLGGAEPVSAQRISQFVEAAAVARSPLVSEHIAFVRAGGLEAGHLLPVPRTAAAVTAIAANVARLSAELAVPLALEPIAAVFDWPDDEYDEADFVTAVLDATGAMLLLDIANVYANCRNRGQDPLAVLDRMPLDRLGYLHVAGGDIGPADGVYHDTHTAPVPPAVLELLAALAERCPLPAVMLERDGNYPPAAELTAELDAIADAARLPRVR